MIFVWALLLAAAVSNTQGVAIPHSSDKYDTTRIIGGDLTTIDRFPSLVQVEFRQNLLYWYQTCAGSILTHRHVLSGAQCFTGFLFSINQRRIRAGSSFRNTGGIIHEINKAFNHPSYSYGNNNYDGDITVLELKSDLSFSNTIRPAIIAPPGFETFDNLPVVHVGWGNTKVGNDASKSAQLQIIQVSTINHELCTARYAALWRSPRVTTNMICAGVLNSSIRDTCDGDEGGPMYFNNDIVVGIVSWGRSCANPTYPRVNTKVSAYTNWIYGITAPSN